MENVKQKVYDLFDQLNIHYSVVTHQAIFSETDTSVELEEKLEGVICKNLFLKDKKKETKYFLVSLPLHKRVNIKELEKELAIKKLTFGTDEELYENLKITPGSVSILNIIEKPNTKVTFIVDEDLLRENMVCFHPNDNTASISFSSCDLVKILNYFEVDYKLMKI